MRAGRARGARPASGRAGDDDGRDAALDEVDGVLDGLLHQQAPLAVEERDQGDAGAGEQGSGHAEKRYARIAP